jgi:hypothetical protein
MRNHKSDNKKTQILIFIGKYDYKTDVWERLTLN